MAQVMGKLLGTHEQTVVKSWAIWSMVTASFSDSIVVMSGDVDNPSFCFNLMTFVKGFTSELMQFIRINIHWSKSNIAASMVIKVSPYWNFPKQYFLLMKYVGMSWTYFGVVL